MSYLKFARRGAAVLAILLGVSCIQEGPVTPPPHVPSAELVSEALRTLEGTLMRCTPMDELRVEQVVGRSGGTITFGPHRLVIPAGALREPTRIRAEIRSENVNSVRLSPEGLRFRTPARLTLSYANCDLLGGLLNEKQIAYTSESLKIYWYLPSVDNVLERSVSTDLDHFSRYAVSW